MSQLGGGTGVGSGAGAQVSVTSVSCPPPQSRRRARVRGFGGLPQTQCSGAVVTALPDLVRPLHTRRGRPLRAQGAADAICPPVSRRMLDLAPLGEGCSGTIFNT